MSGSVNKVILVGNLGADPEIRAMGNDRQCATFSIATSERWTDKGSGEKRERTEWHRVVVFNEALVGVADRYLRKGNKVYVEGQLQTRKWTDQQNVERYSTEIVLQGFHAVMVLLDRPPADPGRHDYSGHDSGRWTGARGGDFEGDGGMAGGPARRPDPFVGDLDDGVPF